MNHSHGIFIGAWQAMILHRSVDVGVTPCTQCERYYARGGGTGIEQHCQDIQIRDLDWAGMVRVVTSFSSCLECERSSVKLHYQRPCINPVAANELELTTCRYLQTEKNGECKIDHPASYAPTQPGQRLPRLTSWAIAVSAKSPLLSRSV